MDTKDRKYGLDILRAFAILFVVYEHGKNLLSSYYTKIYQLPVLDGVSLFFVLSGFLIGGILITAVNQTNFDGNDLFRFWLRRWFRTLPNYYLVLLILFAVRYIADYIHERPFPTFVYSFFLFTQNFNTPHPGFFNEAWSLAVEEWFYLLTPLFIFLSMKLFKWSKRNILLFWILVIITASTLYRTWMGIQLQISDIVTWDLYLRKQVVFRLDSIMFGFLGAYLAYYKQNIWNRYKDLLFVSGLFLIIGQKVYTYIYDTDFFYLSYFSFTVTSVTTLMLLPKLSTIQNGRGVVYKFFTFISIISYSIYIIHLSLIQKQLLPILFELLGILDTNQIKTVLLQYSLYWILTIVLSSLWYKYYEVPTTKLREVFSNYNTKTSLIQRSLLK